MSRRSCSILVIGSGLAGAAVARSLARRGCRDVVVIEQEPGPGHHSSGRNAGMVRTAVEDAAVAELAEAGAEAIRALAVAPDASLPDVHFHPVGGVLLGAAGLARALHLESLPNENATNRHRVTTLADIVDRVPLVRGLLSTVDADECAVETPDDGIVEVHSLLTRYIAEAERDGVEFRYRERVLLPRIEAGRVRGVLTSRGPIETERLVVANGAWAAQWARRDAPIALTPRRRHIVCTRAPAEFEEHIPAWPWVWDLARAYYFRHESSGLLWSPCDESDDEPGSARHDADAASWLAEKLLACLPAAGALTPVKVWAGHRSFLRDGRFLIGPDPRVDGWHWAVGLGGHGVTVSAAIGERVAAAIVDNSATPSEHALRPECLPVDATTARDCEEGVAVA